MTYYRADGRRVEVCAGDLDRALAQLRRSLHDSKGEMSRRRVFMGPAERRRRKDQRALRRSTRPRV